MEPARKLLTSSFRREFSQVFVSYDKRICERKPTPHGSASVSFSRALLDAIKRVTKNKSREIYIGNFSTFI